MEAAVAMPMTVQRAGATLEALEAGEMKLRVRVLESERADRRQGVMQASPYCCQASWPAFEERHCLVALCWHPWHRNDPRL